MIPEYPMDVPKGWLARELALYKQFGIRATAKTPYTEIHAAIAQLPEPQHGAFISAWSQLCTSFGRDENAQRLWDRG
jgi:hypothetical protein